MRNEGTPFADADEELGAKKKSLLAKAVMTTG